MLIAAPPVGAILLTIAAFTVMIITIGMAITSVTITVKLLSKPKKAG